MAFVSPNQVVDKMIQAGEAKAALTSTQRGSL